MVCVMVLIYHYKENANMKRKKISYKKLVLNKKTVAHLDNHDLRSIHGGGPITLLRTNCVTNCLMCPSVKCP